MNIFTHSTFGPFISIVLVSFIVSLGINIVYKYTTNQRIMKQMREDIKKFQKQMRSTKDTTKIMQIQKKAMDVNMRYMMQSMRPTLYTLIPVLFVFGWMASALAFAQILPGEQFSVLATIEEQGNVSVELSDGLSLISFSQDGKLANVTLKGIEGEHKLTLLSGGDFVEKDIMITPLWVIGQPILQKSVGIGGWIDSLFSPNRKTLPEGSLFSSVHVMHQPVHPLGSFSIFGYMPGWVATYIISSLVFSLAMRRAMGLN